MELLNRSSLSLQETFPTVWGLLYHQTSHIFSDLYIDLRQYYRGANVNLEEVLNDFWARLLEKLFHLTNQQYVIGTYGKDDIRCMYILEHLHFNR